ncbi:hypothetical protein [Methylomonas methanica]|nr:hypothetical protein [Methylomonas methanica]
MAGAKIVFGADAKYWLEIYSFFCLARKNLAYVVAVGRVQNRYHVSKIFNSGESLFLPKDFLSFPTAKNREKPSYRLCLRHLDSPTSANSAQQKVEI